jgi:hypothetical protein
MGIYPESFIRPFRNDVGRLLERVERAAPPGDLNLTAPEGSRWVIEPVRDPSQEDATQAQRAAH